MTTYIDQISIDTFAADGFIGRARVLTSTHAGEARQHLETFIRSYGDSPQFADWCYFKSHIILPWVVHLATAPGVVDAVTRILGPDVMLWNSFIPVKAPGSDGHFAWHQDSTYWHLIPVDRLVTVWVALSDVTQDNGGMSFLPRSHLDGQLPHEMTNDNKSMLRRRQRVHNTIDECDAVSVDLCPGEASIHHPFTLHGSAGNRTDDWRLAVSLNFVSADVVPKPGYTESALHVAGEDRNSAFERDPVPTDVMSPESLTALDHAIALSAARYDDV